MEGVEQHGDAQAAGKLQALGGGPEPVVVLDDEPPPDRLPQPGEALGEPLQGGRPVAVDSADVDLDAGGGIQAEEVQHPRVILQLGGRAPGHGRVGGVEQGERVRVHGDAHPVLPDDGADRPNRGRSSSAQSSRFTGWEAKGIRSELRRKKSRPSAAFQRRMRSRQSRFPAAAARKRSRTRTSGGSPGCRGRGGCGSGRGSRCAGRGRGRRPWLEYSGRARPRGAGAAGRSGARP